MKKFITFLIICSAVCFIVPTQVPATLMSTFDSSDELWTAFPLASGGVSGFTFDSTDGNPAGSISAKDAGISVWYFKAPDSWAGNWTSYIGGTITFDLKVSEGDTSSFFMDPATVVIDLEQQNDQVYMAWYRASDPGIDQWTTFSLDITSNNFSIIGSSLTFEQAMANVTGFYILGDYLEGMNEIARIDNVNINPVPDASIMLLLGTGLIGLVASGKKNRK